MMSRGKFSRHAPGVYSVQVDCVRNGFSPPRTVRDSCSLLDGIDTSRVHRDAARRYYTPGDVQCCF
jgi:hypothetical protein